MGIHILPAYDSETFEPTLQWTLFSGKAAALFVLLAGISLAFSSGGRNVHQGRDMVATRVGLLVRALLITTIGLLIGAVMPSPAPAFSILVYYGMFFLLAIPFLGLKPRTLLACSAAFAVFAPFLMQGLRDELPGVGAYNPTFTDLISDPWTLFTQLLLTGTYPALPYMTFICAGLAIGKLDLSDAFLQSRLLIGGAVLGLLAWVSSWFFLFPLGGYLQLMENTPWLGEELIDEVIVWGPDPTLPTTTWWWLTIAGPHTNTPFGLLLSLGVGMAVLGLFLLVSRKIETWLLPLTAMGSMTLTLYSAHLLALSLELHYDDPEPWFLAHLIVAALFAVIWRKFLGQGPLERLTTKAVRITRQRVLTRPENTREI